MHNSMFLQSDSQSERRGVAFLRVYFLFLVLFVSRDLESFGFFCPNVAYCTQRTAILSHLRVGPSFDCPRYLHPLPEYRIILDKGI